MTNYMEHVNGNDMNIDDMKEQELKTSNLITKLPKLKISSFYGDLPLLFQNILDDRMITDEIDKDILLLSSMVGLSSIFKNCYFIHYNKELYMNLFLYIVAPAGSGKSTMSIGKDILGRIHEQKMTEYKKLKETWDLYQNSNKEERSKIGHIEKPCRPIKSMSGDISTAALINAIDNGNNLLFDNEADRLVRSKGESWSNYFSEIKSIFGNETIVKTRIDEENSVGIEKPYLSMCISSTLSTAKQLLNNKEDGQFSRMMIYTFNRPNKSFSCGSDTSNTDIDILNQNNILRDVERLYDYCNRFDNKILLRTSNENRKYIDEKMNNLFSMFDSISDKGLDDVKTRSFIILFRLIYILSIVRHYEKVSIDPFSSEFGMNLEIVSEKIDIDIALKIYKSLSQHILLFAENNTEKSETLKTSAKVDILKLMKSKSLKDFSISQVVELGKENGLTMSVKTYQRYFQDWLKSGIIKKEGKLFNF